LPPKPPGAKVFWFFFSKKNFFLDHPVCPKKGRLDGQESKMDSISLADAKARLSELVDRAAAGETVCITKRGKLVAKLVAAEQSPQQGKKQPIDVEALRKLTSSMTMQPDSAGDFVRRMRDEDRY
jgi:prevent-host-death family protein